MTCTLMLAATIVSSCAGLSAMGAVTAQGQYKQEYGWDQAVARVPDTAQPGQLTSHWVFPGYACNIAF
jgi:hypothetical protein